MYTSRIVLPSFSPYSSSSSQAVVVAFLVSKLGSRVGSSHHHLITSTTCNPRVRGATMTTAAISQQSQHLQQQPEPDSNIPNTPSHSSSVTERPSSSSSRQPSRPESRSMSREQNQQGGAKRTLSGFFPLGYKDAAYQWVSCTHLSFVVATLGLAVGLWILMLTYTCL